METNNEIRSLRLARKVARQHRLAGKSVRILLHTQPGRGLTVSSFYTVEVI